MTGDLTPGAPRAPGSPAEPGVPPEPEAYLVERLREAVAHDPRVAALGISVRVVAGRVVLTGDVATPERKAAVSEVVAPLIEGLILVNELTVTIPTVTDGAEQIA